MLNWFLYEMRDDYLVHFFLCVDMQFLQDVTEEDFFFNVGFLASLLKTRWLSHILSEIGLSLCIAFSGVNFKSINSSNLWTQDIFLFYVCDLQFPSLCCMFIGVPICHHFGLVCKYFIIFEISPALKDRFLTKN